MNNEKDTLGSEQTQLKRRELIFLISNELMALLDKSDILPGYRSDHSMVYIEIYFTKFEKGKGFWKFNNSLLHDQTYVNLVKSNIQKVKEQLLCFRTIHTVKNDELHLVIDDQLFFEQLLLSIRGATIQYCSRKKKLKKERIKLLEKEIKQLEILRNSNDSEDILQN